MLRDGALGISNDKGLVAMWISTVGSFKNLVRGELLIDFLFLLLYLQNLGTSWPFNSGPSSPSLATTLFEATNTRAECQFSSSALLHTHHLC